MDTSFLASLYGSDINTPAAARFMPTPGNRYFVSTFTQLETINAMQLQVFRKQISAAEARNALRNFDSDLAAGILDLVPLPDAAISRAQDLSRQTTAKMGTRSADILHVAAALELHMDGLCSFDVQQRKLAQAMGLWLN